MNQAEKRRKELLEHTRTLYNDSKVIPAIHPRYKSTYQQLYGNNHPSGSLGIRVAISGVLLFSYVFMKYNRYDVLGIDDMQVFEIIMQNTFWKLY